MSIFSLICTYLHHAFSKIFLGAQRYVFLVKIYTPIIENDSELLGADLLSESLGLSIFLLDDLSNWRCQV